MKASIIIPVWNGAPVITGCLEAIYQNCGEELLEVICVDNASSDDSAALISTQYPQVHLFRQSVNLGFAGGVNAGMNAAQGDIFILLNQDCQVQPGWLEALLEAMRSYTQVGIAGSTIYNSDGSVNHTGAQIIRPEAIGQHMTDMGKGQLRTAEFVTGAAVAIRRETWEKTGAFDEGFYPTYYEDVDYCYRARRKGIETAWVPEARTKHLFSNRAWQTDPYQYTTNGYRSRYRFICKHFSSRELQDFFAAEGTAIQSVQYLDHLAGRWIAARYTLRNIAEILECRKADGGGELTSTEQRLMQMGFSSLAKQAYRAAKVLLQPRNAFQSDTIRQDIGSREDSSINSKSSDPPEMHPPFPSTQYISFYEEWATTDQQLQELRQRSNELIARITFQPPANRTPETLLQRMGRILFKRLPSWISGRESALLAQFNLTQLARLEVIEHRIEQATHLSQLKLLETQELEQKIELLEILIEYDDR